MSEETVYSGAPEAMATKWFEEGAEKLHLVDLDGALAGRPVNSQVIKRIVGSIPIHIQLGGGIRDLETIDAYLDLGIHQVILGTVAFKNPGFVADACQKFPNRIILGIDAKKDHVAVEGWTEETDLSPIEMASRYESVGISAIIYTDIHRDGMSAGPNVAATEKLAKGVTVPVIASGGISGIEDVAKVMKLSKYGVTGVITGRALYERTLDLAEAIELTKSKKN
jgi:phosphoribosylformimino-5-aminoimidazole carboxamide ribotide isomerase